MQRVGVRKGRQGSLGRLNLADGKQGVHRARNQRTYVAREEIYIYLLEIGLLCYSYLVRCQFMAFLCYSAIICFWFFGLIVSDDRIIIYLLIG